LPEGYLGWLVLAVFWGLPLLHLFLSPAAGPWRARPGAQCPFSPRMGWIFIVLTLGPLGWLLFVFRRRARTS
jgi:hypothetical protein